jgi:hypothetical protein
VITSGPDGTESSFTFSASEPDARFECRLDGAAFVGCTSPIASGPIAPGAHRFEVRAVDRFGNADLTPAARDFQVAGPAPPGAGSAAAPGRVRLVGGTTLRAARDGAVRMRLACPRATTGCRGTARLLGRPRGKRRGALLASRAFSVPAGATRTVTLRLRGPARTSARRSAGLRAVLELTATGLSGRRSVNVVIRPGRGGR